MGWWTWCMTSAIAWGADPFPAEADWVALERAGAAATDPPDDMVNTGGHDDESLEMLGDPNSPVASWDATETTVFLRLQVEDTADLGPWDWGWVVDTDGNDLDYEFAILVQSLAHQLQVFENVGSVDGLFVDYADVTAVDPGGYGAEATGETRTHTDSGRFYVEAQLPRATLLDDLGIGDVTAVRLAAVTTLFYALAAEWEDTAPCDDTIAGACLVLADVLSDAIVIDADADGLSGPTEGRIGTDPDDADSDDDGLDDGVEHAGPSDPLVCDTDGDGLSDGLEAGVTAPLADTDVLAGCFVADADGATKTDPSASDTDGGGLEDGIEDADRDGQKDAWESDPNDPTDDVDSDGDGIPDVVDDLVGVGDDFDSDGDGLNDSAEGFTNSDSDDLPDFADPDSDDDGLLDGVEGTNDPDADGAPNFRDLDSDNDGVPDAEEGDFDQDGELDDSDSDGTPDLEDTDSDDDLILDGDEYGDVDCDGIPNRIDLDDEDGFCDTGLVIPPIDTSDTGEEPPRFDPDPFAGPGSFTGGACASAPGAPGICALLLLLALVRRRSSVAVAALLAPSVAAAQDVNTDRFAPVVDGGMFVKTVDLELTPTAGSLGLWLDYADEPFVFRPDDPEREDTALVDNVTTARALVSARVLELPLRLGLDFPVHIITNGPGIEYPTQLGDFRLSAEVCAANLGNAHLGATADLTLPSGATSAWMSSGRATFAPGVAASLREGPLLAALNVGFRTGTGDEIGTLEVGPSFRAALGAAVSVADSTSLAGELDGELWLGNPDEPGDVPAELQFSVRHAPDDVIAVSVGGGMGITQGVGAPDFRLMLGLTWGVLGMEVESTLATPPEQPGETGRVVVRVVDPGGHPIGGAGVRVMGTIGVPLATGKDGILEASLPAGAHTVVVSATGWMPAERNVVVRAAGEDDVTIVLFPAEQVRVDPETGQIFLRDKVFFEVDRAELRVDSLATLDALAEVLLARSDLARIRIEGHTDATGTPEHNLELSQARAESVMAYLVSQGVDASRLEAKGMGESRLLQEGDSEEVHATNRRVEFHLVE